MGTKRNKLKKMVSPSASTPPPPDGVVDDDLVDDLLAQLDARDEQVQNESATVLQEVQDNQDIVATKEKKDPKSRWIARQARKAAALAERHAPSDPEADARIEREAKEEEADINRICDELGLEMHEINPDGHCLFSAVADQLALLHILPHAQATYATTRNAAANFMMAHPDDFLPFLPSETGEDGRGTSDTGLMGSREFSNYCSTIRDTGTWGGEPEILALARCYNVPIHVVQAGNPPVVVHDPTNQGPEDLKDPKAARISYHRRMYGLGEHYNSLRPKSGFTRLTSPLKALIS
ncbi:hypothetical protein OF83DRAFT_1059950 [Amylostereum chailletii]|nr:hypothetical protein OF83DRAFT_1059950 [Amylostereum chailletii]